MSEFEFTFPNLTSIAVPFGIFIVAIILMIGIIIYFARNELKNGGNEE